MNSPGSNLAGFFLEFDPALNRLLGADALSKGDTHWVIPQVNGVGIDLVNPGTESVGISLQARNDQGLSLAGSEVTLAGKGHFAAGIEELLPLRGYSGAGRVG